MSLGDHVIRFMRVPVHVAGNITLPNFVVKSTDGKRNEIIYTHHGIVVGDKLVLHMTRKYGLVVTSLEFFKQNSTHVYIRPYSEKEALPVEETIRLAKWIYDHYEPSYDLVDENCEHVAMFCKTGQWISPQVNSITNELGEWSWNKVCYLLSFLLKWSTKVFKYPETTLCVMLICLLFVFLYVFIQNVR